jgi:hypothetical protein
MMKGVSPVCPEAKRAPQQQRPCAEQASSYRNWPIVAFTFAATEFGSGA